MDEGVRRGLHCPGCGGWFYDEEARTHTRNCKEYAELPILPEFQEKYDRYLKELQALTTKKEDDLE